MALAFGDLVEHYDTGRPRLPANFVTKTMARLGCELGSRQLEVGAGTGQLTGALLEMSVHVTALEPSLAMAARLRRRFAREVSNGRLEVREERFEDLDSTSQGGFDHIWSSDAWHWVDLAAGYRLAALVLRPAGRLLSSWGFPVVADPALADELNALYTDLSPDLVRAPKGHLDQIAPLLEDGRNEIDRSGHLTVVDHWMDEAHLNVPVLRYVDWQLSYAHIAAMTASQRRRLADGITAIMDRRPNQPAVPVTIWRYTVASAPSGPFRTRE
ncbi:MAG TPA: class I SAM-dependent methyltransferase [Acidimicrobiales bacterium]|nr:class I SAM-dependent methyltransferase [Acidimicrobiales bacterium]